MPIQTFPYNDNGIKDRRYLNKLQITNCILEAPNGVAEYTAPTVTIKGGIRVLIPNGRNEDGTLKNIEFTLGSDISKTLAENEYSKYLFVKSDSTVQTWGGLYIESDTKPVTTEYTAWFDTLNNKMYLSDIYGENYTLVEMCKLGVFNVTSTDHSLVKLEPDKALRLITESDLKDGGEFRTVIETYQNGTSWYRVWSDGWIEQGGEVYNNAEVANTITFAKPFTNNNYFAVRTPGWNGNYGAVTCAIHSVNIFDATKTSMKAYTFPSAGVNKFRWYACGY